MLGSYPNPLYCLLKGKVGEMGQVGQLLANWVLKGLGYIEHMGSRVPVGGDATCPRAPVW